MVVEWLGGGGGVGGWGREGGREYEPHTVEMNEFVVLLYTPSSTCRCLGICGSVVMRRLLLSEM